MLLVAGTSAFVELKTFRVAPQKLDAELDGEPYAVRVHPGWAETARGTAAEPQFTVATSARTFAGLVSHAIDPKSAVASGKLRIDGSRRALERFLAAFSYPASAGTAVTR